MQNRFKDSHEPLPVKRLEDRPNVCVWKCGSEMVGGSGVGGGPAQVSFPGSPCSLAYTQCVKWPLRGGPVTPMSMYTTPTPHTATRRTAQNDQWTHIYGTHVFKKMEAISKNGGQLRGFQGLNCQSPELLVGFHLSFRPHRSWLFSVCAH